MTQQPPASYAAPPPAARQTLPTTLAHTNAFAVVSIILAFIQPIAGIVFGHIALGQIKRNNDAGRGLALTGVIVGYSVFALAFLVFIAYISFIFVLIGTASSALSGLESYSY